MAATRAGGCCAGSPISFKAPAAGPVEKRIKREKPLSQSGKPLKSPSAKASPFLGGDPKQRRDY